MNTGVSVILPTLNEADQVATALESLANQTYDEFEVVVVDDGSDDGTIEVVRQFRIGGSRPHDY
ncbi:glycosyltransferase [Natronoarchaeum sp. GCM10025703]|uniref:glycosyltransferase n=1 Tax=Natronoarchaeum sp. GCM10025703 TaxID=3252685 RepID=UPI00360638CC